MLAIEIWNGLTLSESAALIRVPDGRIAQSVEQRIENPRVGGSIPPPGTTILLLVSKTSIKEYSVPT